MKIFFKDVFEFRETKMICSNKGAGVGSWVGWVDVMA